MYAIAQISWVGGAQNNGYEADFHLHRVSQMKEDSTSDARQLALIDCFAKATWVALVASLLCLASDAYSIFWMPHRSASDRGPYHAATLFSVTLWTLQIAVAILALWLLRFAFLRPPRFVSKQ
jgi:hypothetical protein